MGKSPGKWIKSVFFGKKSSKSDVLKKAGNEKESIIVAKVPSSDLTENPTSLSNPEPSMIDRNVQNSGIERGKAASFSNEPSALDNAVEHVVESKGTGALDNTEIFRQEKAASVVQAAFRGYLARRAFWALKGIIRLQALIRGHLVRRQAIATLRCMQGIVKLQAMVRGQLARHSEARLHVQKNISLQKSLVTKLDDSNGATRSIQLETLSEYAFVRKLFASSPSAMPLSLQYDPTEPNSSWSWLERWSLSCLWEPLVLMQSSIVHDFQSQKKLGNSQNVDIETTTRPRRSVRRVPTTNTENNLLASTTENGKPKNILKKAVIHQPEAQIENPQNELERVKRSLRKISSSMTEANGRPEPLMEKPSHNFIKVSSSPVADVIELPLNDSSEKISNAKLEDPETQESPKLLEHEPLDEPQSLEKSEKDQDISYLNEELLPKENETSKERRKSSRRKSFSAKQESPENGTQNAPTLPSYMAATVSAKAKLRGQESPRFSQDVADNVIIRRHSLSYSTPGKSNSQSPKMQKMTQANGKGGAKGDRSLLPSRDNNERVTHSDWKR